MSIERSLSPRVACATCRRPFAQHCAWWRHCPRCVDRRQQAAATRHAPARATTTTARCHHCQKFSLDLDPAHLCGNCRAQLRTSIGRG